MLPRIPISVVLCAGGLLVSQVWAAGQATPAVQCASTSAEEQSQPQSSKESPAPMQGGGPVVPLQVTTRLVQVNVIVNDKHGNPVTGLKKEDFVLLDNKTPQEIRVFSAETNLPTAQPSSSAPRSPPRSSRY